MSDEELKKAIDIIINKPIIIQNMTSEDNKEYIGFDKENFETLEQTYYNCQYFARNQEQLMINLKDKDKEIKRLNNIINELEKWLEYSINEHTNVIKSNNDIYWETIHKEKYEDRILIMSLVLDKLKDLKEKSNV